MLRSHHARHAKSSIVWLLVGSFVLTIASFLSAALVAERRATGIESDAQDIAKNALPSIECMSSARTELRQIELLLERLTGTDGRGRHNGTRSELAELAGSRRALATSLERCQVTPPYAGEAALDELISAKVRAMNDSADAVIARTGEGDWAAAVHELETRTEPLVDRVDALMVEDVNLHTRASEELAYHIEGMRSSARRFQTVLMTLSVLLASAAAFFMVRVLRRFTALMEARVSEMEQFAGRVAHDIRSPLTSVGLALELTKRNPERGVSTGMLDRATATVKRIGQLVDDLLVFARSGEVPDGTVTTNVYEIVTAVMEDLRPSADAAATSLELQLQDRGAHVGCSSGVLISLVSNLVGNAIKHMGSSPVRHVVVRVIERGPTLRFEVIDTGPGVPPALASRIFDPFVRAAGTTAPGFGLGLATVRRLAEAHRGAVGVVANPDGSGSVFWFELPKGVAAAAPAARAPSGAAVPATR